MKRTMFSAASLKRRRAEGAVGRPPRKEGGEEDDAERWGRDGGTSCYGEIERAGIFHSISVTHPLSFTKSGKPGQ